MPTIAWKALPEKVREHLLDRVRVREIKATDLAALVKWINADPDVPEGAWCQDFGSFQLVGEGRLPKTFLSRGQPCYGEKI